MCTYAEALIISVLKAEAVFLLLTREASQTGYPDKFIVLFLRPSRQIPGLYVHQIRPILFLYVYFHLFID
jgi:hypothetical protein